MDCKDAIKQLNETISELYETAFNNVVSQYDGILSIVEHEQNMLEEYINRTEEKGYIVSTKYYEALIKNEKKNIRDLQDERGNLLASLSNAVNSGAIKKGSEAWYDMVQQINDVTLAIEEANTALVEYNNSIRDINWEIFDTIQSRISQVSKESDFLIDLLSNKKLYDDKGQLTHEGRSTMGLHGMNYNVYMSQADEYAKELLKINKDLASDPYNQDLVERREELLELQQEMILAAEDEKQAIVDMVEEGIELELDALKDLIDTYTDALDSQKALYDYQKKIAEQTGEIASLEKQQAAYEGDDSEESRAKRQQIDQQLKKAREDLEATEYDKYISDQKQLLDDLYLEYETILNERLDNVDALISDMIFEINNSAVSIDATLNQVAASVGYTLTEEMKNIWGLAAEQMEAASVRRIDEVTQIVNQLVANGQLSQADAQSIIEALGIGDAQGVTNALNIIDQLVANGQLSQSDAQNIQDAMKQVGNDYKGVITSYCSDFQNKATTVQATLDNIKANVAAMVRALNAQAATDVSHASSSSASSSSSVPSISGGSSSGGVVVEEVTPAPSSSSSSKSKSSTSKSGGDGKAKVGDKVKYNSGYYYYDSYGSRPMGYQHRGGYVYITKISSGHTYPYHISTGKRLGSGDLGWVKLKQLRGYYTGKKNIMGDEYAWTQEKGEEYIVRPSDGAILTPVARKDSVLSAEASNNIWNMANNPTDFVRGSLKMDNVNVPNNTMAQNTYTQNLDKVVFNLPNVKSYDELLYAMQRDKNFERLILSMTIDRLAGRSSLAKYHTVR